MTGFEPRNSCFRKQPLYRLGSGKLKAWSISIFDQMNYLPPFYLTSQLFIAEMVCSLIQKYLTISLSPSLSLLSCFKSKTKKIVSVQSDEVNLEKKFEIDFYHL